MSEPRTARWRGLRFEWSAFQNTCAATLDLDVSERRLVWHLALPFLFSVFIGMRMPVWVTRLPFKHRRAGYDYQGLHRAVGVRVFDSAIWWSLWEDINEMRSCDPWWYRGRLGLNDIATLLFGRERVECATIEEKLTLIDMPERKYPATFKRERMVWTRPRLPRFLSHARITSSVDVHGGVPIPGKGENSWDCDDDALFSQSSAAATEAEAVASFCAAVMRDRERYGGRRWRAPEAAT